MFGSPFGDPFGGLVPVCKVGSPSAGDCSKCVSDYMGLRCCRCGKSHRCNVCPIRRPDLYATGGTVRVPVGIPMGAPGGIVPVAMGPAGPVAMLPMGAVTGGRFSPTRGLGGSSSRTGGDKKALQAELASLVRSGSSDPGVQARIKVLKETLALLS